MDLCRYIFFFRRGSCIIPWEIDTNNPPSKFCGKLLISFLCNPAEKPTNQETDTGRKHNLGGGKYRISVGGDVLVSSLEYKLDRPFKSLFEGASWTSHSIFHSALLLWKFLSFPFFFFFPQNARKNKWMEAREHFLYPLMHITKPCRGSSYILAVAHRHCVREASVFADWMFGEARSPWGCSWTGRNPNPPPSPLHGPQTGRSRETEGCWSLKRRRMNCWRAMLLKLQTNWRIIILQQHFSWRISSPRWSIWEKISGH